MKTVRYLAKLLTLIAIILAIGTSCICAQAPDARQPDLAVWTGLLQQGKCDDARALCEGWAKSAETKTVAEGHKCLASVSLCGSARMVLQAGDAGGGYLGQGYTPEAVDEALGHLGKAMHLSPQDLSIHQGRLHILIVGGRFGEMADALEESLRIYHGSAPETWIAYSYELYDAEQYRSGIRFLKALEKSFPNNHQVVGNLGAFHSLLKEDEEALRYLLRAVELAPSDPLDTWNLGRHYDFLGKVELADEWYKKSLNLQDEPSHQHQKWCTYAEFVSRKLNEPARGCEIQQQYGCDRIACN